MRGSTSSILTPLNHLELNNPAITGIAPGINIMVIEGQMPRGIASMQGNAVTSIQSLLKRDTMIMQVATDGHAAADATRPIAQAGQDYAKEFTS